MSKVVQYTVLIVLFSGIIPGSGIALRSQSDTTLSKKQKRAQISYVTMDKKWYIEIPIWVPGFAGEFSYGNVTIEGEDGSNPGTPSHPIEPPDPGEPPIGGGNIISRLFTSSSYLKFFFMNQVVYKPGKFHAQFDTFAGAVGNNVKFKLNDKTVVNAEFRAILFRLFGAYTFYDKTNKAKNLRYSFSVFAGGRFHIFHVDTQLFNTSFGFDIDPYWVEPLVGLQANLLLKKWAFQLIADHGGFYINNKSSYMINGQVTYRTGGLVSVNLGWNDWRIIHRGTFRGETLYIKTHLSGPNTGIIFHF